METVLIVVGVFAAYLIAYHTYGRFLARRIFVVDDRRETPAHTLRDDSDYVPTRLEILFGHHYTSIAGTGPIVGPAIAVIWGWVPALLWVVLGSIFMGAVLDFGSIMVSIRHQGRTIGDVAREVINPRVQRIFLLIIFFGLLIVLALFSLVIAKLFELYPHSIVPIWTEIPIAIWLGRCIYKKKMSSLGVSLIAVALLYLVIYLTTLVDESYFVIPTLTVGAWQITPLMVWTVVLLVYIYIASTLPVHVLLQPRDFINGYKIFIAMGLLALGVLVAKPDLVAPAVQTHPKGAPPMFPFLFITIACGAISGFHCLVASGTTAKQISRESHARVIGYGGMLAEGMLATFVIIAVAAGIGLAADDAGRIGAARWQHHYASWDAADGLGAKVSGFVDGAANLMAAFGMPQTLGVALMGVFVATYAATTLDTCARLQRYVVTELAGSLKLTPLTNKYAATLFAVVTGGILALAREGGEGGLILWPLFGATNQLLGCLALLVITVWLRRLGRPIVYTLAPMLLMLVITAWSMAYNLTSYYEQGELHLLVIGAAVLILELWMVVEGLLVLVKQPLPTDSRGSRPGLRSVAPRGARQE